MLLKGLVLALAMTGAMSCSDDETTPPLPDNAVEVGDQALKEQLLAQGVDANNDGYITNEELAAVRTLDLSYTSGAKITTITELQYLASVEELKLDGQAVRSLTPIASLKNLKRLSVRKNGSVVVGDLSGLESLEELDLSENALTGTAEEAGEGGQLNSLDLENNLKLRKVTVNEEVELDCIVVNGLPEIESLEATGCDKLLYVYAMQCPKLKSIDVHGGKSFLMPWITESKALESLDCSDCKLYSTEHMQIFTHEYPALRTLLVSGNASLNNNDVANFREVDFSLLPALETLDISGTCFVNLDFTANRQLRVLHAENMPNLKRIDLRNDSFPAGADYRIVEGNPELKFILVDLGDEKTAVEALVGSADITVTNDPEGGDISNEYVPVPAPAEGSDADLSPKSIGAMMWYPPKALCGKTLAEVKTAESGTLKAEMTAETDGYTISYFAQSDEDIKYRAYWIGEDGKVAKIGNYVVTREKFLVKKEGAWIMNPNFNPTFPKALESLGERDGAFYYKGAPYGESFSYEFGIRAVLLDGVEYAEVMYTLAE